MRFMILIKSCEAFEAAVTPDPDPAMMAAMAAYHAELARAGVLPDLNGLKASRSGWRIHYGTDGCRQTMDGPFTEAKELIGGYTLIQVCSRERAVAWSRRFPNPAGEGAQVAIEARQLFEMHDSRLANHVSRWQRWYLKPDRKKTS